MVGLYWEVHRSPRTAKYVPRNPRGTEIPNHWMSREDMVVNGTAPDEMSSNEEVEHVENVECDPGKQVSRPND